MFACVSVEVAEGVEVGDEHEEEGVGGLFGMGAFCWGAGDEVLTGGFGAEEIVGSVDHRGADGCAAG